MPRHISKKDQANIIISELKSDINRENVDFALPILKWTKEKLTLDIQEKERVKRFLSSGKTKNKPRYVKRGDVYYAKLGKNIGSEQNAYRPVLVVQNQGANVTSPTVIVIPLTDAYDSKGNAKRVLKTHCLINHTDLKKPSIAKAEYIRSISKNRLIDRVCSLDKATIQQVELCIKASLQLT